MRKLIFLLLLSTSTVAHAASNGVNPLREDSSGVTEPSLAEPLKCHMRAMYFQPSPSGVATILGFTVAADGTVQDVSVMQSSGDWQRDEAYSKCISGTKFVPAMQNGAAVAAHTQMTFN